MDARIVDTLEALEAALGNALTLVNRLNKLGYVNQHLMCLVLSSWSMARELEVSEFNESNDGKEF